MTYTVKDYLGRIKNENIIAFSIIFQHLDGAFISPSSQYSVCWWPGDAKNQGITYNGINLVLPEYFGISTRSVIHLMVDFQEYFRPAVFAINNHINGTVWTLADSIHDVYIDGLVQERRNSIANALELRLSCTGPSIWYEEDGRQIKASNEELVQDYSIQCFCWL